MISISNIDIDNNVSTLYRRTICLVRVDDVVKYITLDIIPFNSDYLCIVFMAFLRCFVLFTFTSLLSYSTIAVFVYILIVCV
jgi:hypothetical protein